MIHIKAEQVIGVHHGLKAGDEVNFMGTPCRVDEVEHRGTDTICLVSYVSLRDGERLSAVIEIEDDL